jgi:hypothetical protein
VRRDTAKVRPTGAVLDQYQDIQPGQQHGIDVKEVGGEDPIAPTVTPTLKSPWRDDQRRTSRTL